MTDGEDTASYLDLDELLGKIMRSNINLIIIGMNLEERTKKDLNKLCRSTYDGMLLEAINDETSIDIAF